MYSFTLLLISQVGRIDRRLSKPAVLPDIHSLLLAKQLVIENNPRFADIGARVVAA
jgi:hypothetical protein